jgi:excinuclease ABC subunit C
VVGALVKGSYLRGEDLPPELVVPSDFEDRDLVEEYLSLRRDGEFRIHVARRGRKRRLIELAEENARHLMDRDGGDGPERRDGPAGADGDGDLRAGRPPRAARSLAESLGLDEAPRSILCFDVSTLGGSESVGSAVWLEDGRPSKDEYRRFRIRSVPRGETDDYAMMQEIVGRYFDRRVREGDRMPDLVLVDGGKGQMAAAAQALESAGAGDLPLASLAKRDEEVFVPGRSDPVRLPRTDPGLHWLQRARDEAHRFAVTYSRTLRKRRTLRSRLSEVPGVGAEREQRLLRRFGSLDAVREASEEELREVSGIGPTTARRIRERLRNGSSPA